MLNYHSTDGILAAKDYLIDQVHPIRQCELLRNARVGYAITVEALKASYPDYVHYVGTLRLQNGHPRHFLTTEPPLNYDDRLGHQLASE